MKNVKLLNELITGSEDGLKGYTEAAEIATDGNLKALFTTCAAECSGAITELQSLVAATGQKPDDSGSVTGAIHRVWVKVKANLEDSNIAVLEEVERGQDHAKAAYVHAPKAELEPNVRASDIAKAGRWRTHQSRQDP